MNIDNMVQELKFIQQLGITINVEERLKLEIILQKLKDSQSFDYLKFWGKIEGTIKDYYIAYGLNFKDQYEFPLIKFFYSNSDFKDFQELPNLDLDYKEKVESYKQSFTGLPDKILIQVENIENAEVKNQDPVDSDDEVIKVISKNFTEIDRLAYVINAIEVDCQVLPVGSLRITQKHELELNETFRGLNSHQILDIKNYQHFRNPQSKHKQQLLLKDDTIYRFDFLDSIQNDLPQGCWSIQSGQQKSYVTIRNLLWMGYVGYHKENTQIFGGVYIGNGLKNQDLPFQLP